MYCSGWTYPVASLKELSIKAPMLFVTADFDASTPTEWATFAWKNSSNSGLVVRHGDDHTTFNCKISQSCSSTTLSLLIAVPKSKVTSLEKEFLRTGRLPAAQNGTEYTVYHHPQERVAIPNPYDVPTGIVAGDCPRADVGCNLQ